MICIIRVAQGKNSTLSHLYIDNLFACYLLEDAIRPVKIPGTTCIPEGEYRLAFNRNAPMHTRYGAKFPRMHQGMIEITGIPEFSLVFFHSGNYHTDTAGCPLTGSYWERKGDDYVVWKSVDAYKWVYPMLVKEMESKVVVYNQCFHDWDLRRSARIS